MSEKIRIKAAKNAPEFVTVGDFQAHKEREFFVVEDRKFADFIISEGYGIEEGEKIEDVSDLPDEFPSRDVFVGVGLSLEQIKSLDKTGLLELKGVGEKTADAVLTFLQS